MNPVNTIRTAVAADHKALEALQWRASLNNPGDREALLAHPEVVALAREHLERGQVFVAEVTAPSTDSRPFFRARTGIGSWMRFS
jgi:hypothetical protein